jgi:hypothetical protein
METKKDMMFAVLSIVINFAMLDAWQRFQGNGRRQIL